MIVEAQLEETLVDGPHGDVDGLTLTCGDCNHTVECPGSDTPEARQCLIDCLNAECPEHRRHKVKIII
jgi:hypothetical protein